MANTNVTRLGDTHEKKAVSVMIFSVSPSNFEDLGAGNFLVGYLPNKAIITGAMVFTTIASDAAAVTVGTTEGGTEILSAGDSTTLNATGTFTGKTSTGTGVPVFVNLAVAPTTGAFDVVVEYIESTLSTGNLTKVD